MLDWAVGLAAQVHEVTMDVQHKEFLDWRHKVSETGETQETTVSSLFIISIVRCLWNE